MITLATDRWYAETQHSVFPGFDRLGDDVTGVVRHLTARRRAAGLTQAEIAARMRTSQSAVARLEAGRSEVRLSTLQRYADALGHTVRVAVTEDGDAGDLPAPVDDGSAQEDT